MRVQNYKSFENDPWTRFGFDTTYPIGWLHCLAYAKAVFDYTENAEVLVAPIAGAAPHKVEIEKPDDIWDIPEAGCIIVRGHNKVYDGTAMQFHFFNQLTQVYLDVHTGYLDSLKKNETELLDSEGKKHVFDRYMDSIEVVGEGTLSRRSQAAATADELVSALMRYDELYTGEGEFIYKDKFGVSINLTALVNKIRKTGE